MKRSSKSIVTMVLILAIALFSYFNQEKSVDNVGEVTNTTTEIAAETTANVTSDTNAQGDIKLDEKAHYYAAEEVALYIHTYDKLPDNYLTKNEANELGWDSDKGNLWDVTDQMVIGGDRFGNREGLLPNKQSRIWYECDVNYEGGFRNGERLVFSNDGLIYFTDDHYATFEKWYD